MFDVLDMECHVDVLYHRSSKLFERPCWDKIREAREWSSYHPNGQLGLWCAPFSAGEGFGQYIYQVTIHGDAVKKAISLSDLYRLTSELEEWEEFVPLKKFLYDNGIDILFVSDATERAGEIIVLNFDKIDISLLEDNEPLPDNWNYPRLIIRS